MHSEFSSQDLERRLFDEALDLPPGPERDDFLAGACRGNEPLRQRLQALLRVEVRQPRFLPQSVPAVVPPAENPSECIGRYKLLQELGEGGFGTVWMAEQMEPVSRRVALKIIKLGMDSREIIARFEAERQALAMMEHPNIAKVLDAGTTAMGRPYFVMELVRGIRITDYCDQHHLSTGARLELFIAVCQAVEHAHQKGIIHRDLKPSNILVTLHDGVPVPKVIDFGIAKATGQKLTEKTLFTQLNQFMGTPAYMSPEQAEMSRLDIDTRSDIYSLGVLLYELLTGQPPFDGHEMIKEGLDAMRRTIREVEPSRPSTRLSTLAHADLDTVARARGTGSVHLRSQLRGDLDWIVMKALEKDRTRRYKTAGGLATDIKRHLNHEPIVARPPTTAYRFRKAWRRNRLAFSAAAAVALALVLGVVASTWQATVATRERTRAVTAQGESEKSREAERQQRLQADRERVAAEGNLYAAKMNLAQLAWKQNNLGRLRQLLNDTEESPNRGFEWYYWQRQTHQPVKTLWGHLDAVRSAVFSPDGERIATSGDDCTAKVWDAASGRELLALKGHRGSIWSVAWSPDGRRIATGSFDRSARVWEVATGRELLTLTGHAAGVLTLAWSPDGGQIVTGSNDMTAKVWDAACGKELLTLTWHTGAIVSVAFSPDGQWIATGSVDESAKMWETASGRGRLTLKGHRGTIKSVAFSPDGRRLATAGADNTARVWEVPGGRELQTFKGHSFCINGLAWSPDGQRIATGSSDQTARVWEVSTGRELFTLRGHSSDINSVAFSPDGRRIVTSSHDQTARVWNAASERETITLSGHRDSIQSVAFSADSQRILTGSFDRTARVWDVAGGKELLGLTGHRGWVWSAAFSADSQRIATGSFDQTARIWEAATGRELLTLTGHSDSIRTVAWSPDGRLIATGSFDRSAKLWETATGRELFTLAGHGAAIGSVAFSPDGQRMVTGSFDRTARMWEVASGKELGTFTGHSGGIWSVAFSPDGERIATGSSDQTAKIWDAAAGRELFTLTGHRDSIQSVAFSRDGRRIVTGSLDQTAKIWEAATGRELLTLAGHSDAVGSVAFSPDGQRIVTGSGDRTAKVWEAAWVEQVIAWQEEERAASLSLAASHRERTADRERQRIARDGDEGALKSWLILAPIPLAAGQDGTRGLNVEQIKGEAFLRPTAGETRSIGDGELTWRVVVLEDYGIDFNAILGNKTERSAAYAVCYIESEAAQSGLQMLIGSNDQSKLYLNGKQIHQCNFSRNWIPDQDTVRNVCLNAGLNTVVFKVVNDTTEWLGSVRFTDARGQPVKGIKAKMNSGRSVSSEPVLPH
jgi:WD40 repeat protein/serine/threonine protein kinase